MSRKNENSYQCDGCAQMYYDHYCPPCHEAFGFTVCYDCDGEKSVVYQKFMEANKENLIPKRVPVFVGV